MAKFNRFDPRNKKRDKHKTLSKDKPLPLIKEVEEYPRVGKQQMLQEVVYDNENDSLSEPQQLNS
jgi:hypothetical protein